MNKMLKIALLLVMTMSIIGTTSCAKKDNVTSENESIIESTTANTSKTTTSAVKTTKRTVETTTAKKKEKKNIPTVNKSDLLNYYWENNIQSPKIYEFTNDGIVIEYDGNLKYSVDKSTWYECRRFKYSLSDDKLVLNCNVETNLKYITKKENINWDNGLKFYNEINETDYFFYQTDFVRTGAPSENAMYLIKSLPKEKIVDTSSILDIKTNERFNKTEIIEKLELHYNSLPNITGTYSITDVEDSETELKACLRYSMSNEEAEEIIANGGFPTPNKLVAMLTVSKSTGLVTVDNGDTWNL